MPIVTVVAARDFGYQGRVIYSGDAVEMEAIEAAVHAQRGDVNLNAQPTYRTREMVAKPLTADVAVPVRARRGRPRKIASA